MIDAGGAVPAEITFDVAQEVSASKSVFDLEVEAGELRRGAEFRDPSQCSVAERYARKIGGDVALRVRGPIYIFEVNESTGGQYGIADFDGRWTGCLSRLLRLRIRRLARGVRNVVGDFWHKV